ncbi:DUF1801 domain-containing protein [Leptospira sp. WS92.C1]
MYLFSFIPIPTFIMSSEIHNYIESQTEIRKKRLLSLRTWIVDSFPEIQESMKYRMPTYQLEENWIAFASQKNYISIYLCDANFLKDLKRKFPTLITGKACLNIKDNDPFPFNEIQTSIRLILKSKPKLRISNGKSATQRNSPSKRNSLRQNTLHKK